MTKTISVTNDVVLDTLNNATNASELITVAVLYYLDMLDKNYVDAYKILQNATIRLKEERRV